jgi:hypothetical protein
LFCTFWFEGNPPSGAVEPARLDCLIFSNKRRFQCERVVLR